MTPDFVYISNYLPPRNRHRWPAHCRWAAWPSRKAGTGWRERGPREKDWWSLGEQDTRNRIHMPPGQNSLIAELRLIHFGPIKTSLWNQLFTTYLKLILLISNKKTALAQHPMGTECDLGKVAPMRVALHNAEGLAAVLQLMGKLFGINPGIRNSK